MKLSILPLLVLLFITCKPSPETNASSEESISFKNKGHELIYKITQKVGDHQLLTSKKDVSYTYTYTTPDGKSDVSQEKYIFDGELSYGKYITHERTLADLEGVLEQGYDGQEFWLKQNSKLINDSTALKRVAFNRPTNYYWFTMFQKLLDPGLIYEYLGTTTVDGIDHEVVKVSFESQGKPTDIYQVYIDKERMLVDQFLFTVADFGKMETPFLMQIEYENIDGLLIPTKRKYKASDWDAIVTNDPWIHVNWSDIKFNNGWTKSDFEK